jgi:hypothetical protein
MPLVFVHGVNTRKSAEYDSAELARNALFRRYALTPIKGDAAAVRVFNPYWGDEAAKFPWNCGFAHDTQPNLESFGPDSDAFDQLLDSAHVEPTPAVQNNVILAAARKDFPLGVDLLWAAAGLSAGLTEDDAADLAKVSVHVRQYASTHKDAPPAWLATTASDGQFAQTLLDESEKWAKSAAPPSDVGAPAVESFGAMDNILDRLKRGARDAADRAADAAFGRFVDGKIPNLVRRFSTFFGDVFEYVKQSYSHSDHIAGVVADQVREAGAIAITNNEPLLCIGHSMGGNILYDLLTDPDQENLPVCDLFVTVGSQVGLFEELKLFRSSVKDFPANPTIRVPITRHPLIKKWTNVFDRADPFGYPASTIFAGVKDFSYDTEVTSLSAHGAYFLQPGFHERLRERIVEMRQ